MREELVELLAKAIREEIVRQYRDDERRKCPAGAHFYEEQVAPGEIARACLAEIASSGMVILERAMIVDVFTEARESGLISKKELQEVLGPLAGE